MCKEDMIRKRALFRISLVFLCKYFMQYLCDKTLKSEAFRYDCYDLQESISTWLSAASKSRLLREHRPRKNKTF